MEPKVGALGEAMGILSHKLGRAVYFMLKRKEAFNESAFLNGQCNAVIALRLTGAKANRFLLIA